MITSAQAFNIGVKIAEKHKKMIDQLVREENMPFEKAYEACFVSLATEIMLVIPHKD